MARILISFSSPIHDNGSFQIGCYYEGFIKAFEDEGNEVLVINCVEFLHQSWNNQSNALPFYFNRKRIVNDVKEFKPELVFSYNHCIPLEVEEACDCPIVLFDSDSLSFFSDKDYMKRNLDKYTFFCYAQLGIKNALAYGVQKDKIYHIRSATYVQKEAKEIEQNISFIGSTFAVPRTFVEALETEDIDKVKELAGKLFGGFFKDTDDVFESMGMEHITKKVQKEILLSLASPQERTTVLNSLQDFGLSIWGPRDWLESASFLPWLAMCYKKDKVYSLKHNQDIYNSSKLCVSIAHSQTIDGFPFRTMDIMASNGCLVTDYHSALADITKGYVDLPVFENPYDARDLCKKLLKEDNWREDVVLGSQKFVDENCRWQHRFKEMEEALGIQLLNIKPKIEEQSQKNDTIYLKKTEYVLPVYAFFKIFVVILIYILPNKFLRSLYFVLNRTCGFCIDQQIVREARSGSKNIKDAFDGFVKSIQKTS